MAGRSEASPLQTALHRMRVSTNDRVDAIPAEQWVQDLYRNRRRAGVCARLCWADLRCASRASRRQHGQGEIRVRQERQSRANKIAEVLLVNDKTGKPEGINMAIGRRPQ